MRNETQLCLFYIFVLSLLFTETKSVMVTFPTPTPLSFSQSGSNRTWTLGSASNNCGSGVATSSTFLYTGFTNILTFSGWDTSELNNYSTAKSAIFQITSNESSNCFMEPKVILYNRCGTPLSVDPVITKSGTTDIQRTYNWTLSPTNLDYWRNNLSVSIQVPVSPNGIMTCTWTAKCIVMKMHVDTTPGSGDTNVCAPSPTATPSPLVPSPSVLTSSSPTPSPTATPSVTPSRTPSISVSPSVTPSSTPSPIPSSSSSVSPTPSVTPSTGASTSPTPSFIPSSSPSSSPALITIFPSQSSTPSASPSASTSPSSSGTPFTPSPTPSNLPSSSVSPSTPPSQSPSVSSIPTQSPAPSTSGLPSSSPSPSSMASPSGSTSPAASTSPSAIASSLPSSSSSASVTPSTDSMGADNEKSSSKKSNKAAVFAGAITGAVLGVAILGAFAFFLVSRRRKTQETVEDPKTEAALEEPPAPTDSRPVYGNAPKRPLTNPAGAQYLTKNRTGMLTTTELYVSNLKLKGLLGNGKFGEVYEGVWHGTTAVACKKLKKDDMTEFENEVALLMKLNHPNVVRCLGIWNNPSGGEIYMILELLRLGSLTDFLRNPEAQKKLAIADLVEMCVNAASGMVFLEQKNIVHRDLGARNLLVTESDGRYVVKIADLGLSREVEQSDAIYDSKEGVFPVRWSPPEVVNFRKFTSKSDVWSFAITMWEIFELGKVPYPTFSNDEAVTKIMQGYRLPRPETCPQDVYRLMMMCWAANPDERPDFQCIHEHLLKVLENIQGEKEEEQTAAIPQISSAYNNDGPAETITTQLYNTATPETYNTIPRDEK